MPGDLTHYTKQITTDNWYNIIGICYNLGVCLTLKGMTAPRAVNWGFDASLEIRAGFRKYLKIHLYFSIIGLFYELKGGRGGTR